MSAVQHEIAVERAIPERIDLSAVLVWALAIALVVPLALTKQADPKNIDFTIFYTAAKMGGGVYDGGAQKAAMGTYFAYPPVALVALRPLAALPFWTAYRTYQALSAGLFLVALIGLRRAFLVGHPLGPVVIPLAFASRAFVAYTWLNGQFSVVGFAALAFALVALRSRRLFLAGLALAVCSYKPPLLMLLLPMLLYRRQWRVLAGFASGFAVLAGSATAIYGWRIWPAYFSFARAVSGDILRWRPVFRYADLSAFCALLHLPHYAPMVGGLALPLVFLAWRNYDLNPALAWSVSIMWTLILSPYTPLYDTIMIVPALIAAAPVLGKRAAWAMWAFFACSWISEELALSVRVQVLTVALVFVAGCVWVMGRAAMVRLWVGDGDRR